MRRRVALLASIGLLVVGLGASGDHKARKAYLDAYNDVTKHLVLYWEFQTALNLRATYLTPSFRVHIAEERRRLLNPTEEDNAQYLARLQSDGDAYHEIVFSADSGMEAGDKFSTNDDGWQVALTADGTAETLVTLFKVTDPNMLQRTLYPHFNLWSDLWIARFQRTVKAPDVVIFSVGGGYGHGELRWDGLRGS